MDKYAVSNPRGSNSNRHPQTRSHFIPTNALSRMSISDENGSGNVNNVDRDSETRGKNKRRRENEEMKDDLMEDERQPKKRKKEQIYDYSQFEPKDESEVVIVGEKRKQPSRSVKNRVNVNNNNNNNNNNNSNHASNGQGLRRESKRIVEKKRRQEIDLIQEEEEEEKLKREEFGRERQLKHEQDTEYFNSLQSDLVTDLLEKQKERDEQNAKIQAQLEFEKRLQFWQDKLDELSKQVEQLPTEAEVESSTGKIIDLVVKMGDGQNRKRKFMGQCTLEGVKLYVDVERAKQIVSLLKEDKEASLEQFGKSFQLVRDFPRTVLSDFDKTLDDLKFEKRDLIRLVEV